MTSEENKSELNQQPTEKLADKTAQIWLKLRRHTGPGADLTEQELKDVSGGDGPPSTAGDGNGRMGRHFLPRN